MPLRLSNLQTSWSLLAKLWGIAFFAAFAYFAFASFFLDTKPAAAQDTPACEQFNWPVKREQAAFTATDLRVVPSGARLDALPERGIILALKPNTQVAFAIPPERQPKNADRQCRCDCDLECAVKRKLSGYNFGGRMDRRGAEWEGCCSHRTHRAARLRRSPQKRAIRSPTRSGDNSGERRRFQSRSMSQCFQSSNLNLGRLLALASQGDINLTRAARVNKEILDLGAPFELHPIDIAYGSRELTLPSELLFAECKDA